MKRILLAIIICGLAIYFRHPLKALANGLLKEFSKPSPSSESTSQSAKTETSETNPSSESTSQYVEGSEASDSNQRIKCYNGFVEIGKPMSLNIRKTTCEEMQQQCTIMKVTDELNGTEYDTIIGGCGSFMSSYQCQMLSSTFPLRKKCEVTTCEGDFCNKEVFEVAKKERERLEKNNADNTGKRLKCNTGQLMDLPSIAPKADIDKQVDECLPSTKECITLLYDLQVFFMGEFTYRTAFGICKDPDVKCEDYCEKTKQFMSIKNCKTTCCSTDECNRLQIE